MAFPRCARLQPLVFATPGLLAVRPAASGVLKERWSLADHHFIATLGSTDADLQPELLVAGVAFVEMAVMDGATGQIEQSFSAFRYPDAGCVPVDINNEGRMELFFSRSLDAPARFTAYQWNGASYAKRFSGPSSRRGRSEVRAHGRD